MSDTRIRIEQITSGAASSGDVPTADGSGGVAWQAQTGGGMTNPMTTQDDIIVGGASGAPTRLGKGSDSQVLTVDPTTHHLVWQDPPGASGGATVYTGAYASPPPSPAAGDLWLPSDSYYALRYGVSGWSAWGPVFPLVPPPSAGWIWVNQGSATIDSSRGALVLTQVGGVNSVNLRCYVRSAPATPYSIVVGLTYVVNAASANSRGGVLWRQSSNGQLTTAGFLWNTSRNQFLIDKWPSPTGSATNYNTTDMSVVPYAVFIKLQDDGVNRSISFGADPYNFQEQYSMARTDYITPDQVGFFVDSDSQYWTPILSVIHWQES